VNVENLGDTEIVSPKSLHKDKHIDALETKVDRLEEQVISLKQKLKQATKQPKDFVSQEQYYSILSQLQEYWDTEHPF